MSLAENIYHHSRRLPEEAAREALDFIQFLEQRYASKSILPAQPKDTESFLAAIAGKLSDDFPDDITDNHLCVMEVPVSHLKDSDLQKSPQALLRAAENARKLAEQTGTKLVLRKSVNATVK